jgi:transketolase
MTVKTLATEVKKITETKPFYALTGVGDYAVEKLRELQSRSDELPTRAKEVQAKAQEYAKDFPAKAQAYANDFPAMAREIPAKAREYADTVTNRLTEIYDEMAVRGRKASRKNGKAMVRPVAAKPAPKPAAAKAPVRKPAATVAKKPATPASAKPATPTSAAKPATPTTAAKPATPSSTSTTIHKA